MRVKIKDIKVEERFRHEYGNIEELAESIAKHGLIQPPVLSSDYTLIAGERRLRACKFLELEEIEVRFMNELGELEQKEIELEENLHRKQFTWQEEVRAKKSIHEIKQRLHGEAVKGHGDGWGYADTAGELDESLGTIHQDIKLAKALEEFPELVEEENKSKAWKKLKKLREGETIKELEKVLKQTPDLEKYELVEANCLDWLKDQEDESIDLVIADPPWGIGMDTASALSKSGDIEYNDTLEDILVTVDLAVEEFYRVLKPDAHLYLYFGISNYELFKDIAEHAGFTVDPVPLIWNKNQAGAAAKGRTYPVAYETIFFCYKGKRDLNTTHHNVFTEKKPLGAKRIHSAQKPVNLEKQFVLASTNPGDTVLIPFAGSGAAVIAAVTSNRYAIGLEKTHSNFVKMQGYVKSRVIENIIAQAKNEI